MGGKVSGPKVRVTPPAPRVIKQFHAPECGRCHCRRVALQPTIPGRVATDQGALKRRQGPCHDVAVKRPAKPFLCPRLIPQIGGQDIHQCHGVLVEFEGVLNGRQDLRFQAWDAALAMKSWLPRQIEQPGCVAKTDSAFTAYAEGHVVGEGQFGLVAAGATQLAVRGQPGVEEEVSTEFPFGLIQRVVLRIMEVGKMRWKWTNVFQAKHLDRLRPTTHRRDDSAKKPRDEVSLHVMPALPMRGPMLHHKSSRLVGLEDAQTHRPT